MYRFFWCTLYKLQAPHQLMVIVILYQNNLSFNLKRDQEGHPATHDTEGAGGEIVFELWYFHLNSNLGMK